MISLGRPSIGLGKYPRSEHACTVSAGSLRVFVRYTSAGVPASGWSCSANSWPPEFGHRRRQRWLWRPGRSRRGLRWRPRPLRIERISIVGPVAATATPAGAAAGHHAFSAGCCSSGAVDHCGAAALVPAQLTRRPGLRGEKRQGHDRFVSAGEEQHGIYAPTGSRFVASQRCSSASSTSRRSPTLSVWSRGLDFAVKVRPATADDLGRVCHRAGQDGKATASSGAGWGGRGVGRVLVDFGGHLTYPGCCSG